MQTETEKKFGWTFRSHLSEASPFRILLLLHGWTGDENSMWTFTKKFSNYAFLSPRAPYLAPAERGGYSWREIKPGTWGSPTLEELHLALIEAEENGT